MISTISGPGVSTVLGDGGPATAGYFVIPQCIAFDKTGNLYVADADLGRVRKISTAGIITTVAGTGINANAPDGGQATATSLNYPMAVAVDTSGNIYISERYGYRVRKVSATTSLVSTAAGNGTTSFTGAGSGGPATAYQFNTPGDLKCDQKGNLYISDGASVLLKVNSAGIISIIAGIPGSVTSSGNGGPATAAHLYDPRYFTFDDTGNIYIAEVLAHYVRKVDIYGIIHLVGGTGMFAYNGDSIAATSANLNPNCIGWFNDAVYIGTSDHHIRKIDLTNDTVYNIAGTGTGGYNGDAIPATAAQVYNPSSLVMRECGSVYFADGSNRRIRKITNPPVYKHPTITLAGSTSVAAGLPVTVTATVSNAGGHYAIRWMNHGIPFATTTVPSVTYTKPTGIDTITARVVSTVPDSCYDSTSSLALTVNVRVGVNSVYESSGCMIYPTLPTMC